MADDQPEYFTNGRSTSFLGVFHRLANSLLFLGRAFFIYASVCFSVWLQSLQYDNVGDIANIAYWIEYNHSL